MQGSRLPLVVRLVGIFTVAVLPVLTITPATDGGTSARAVRNLAITFTCPHAICAVKPDGSGRAVFVTAWFDSFGDPSWTRDGTALAYFVGYSDTHKIHVFQVPTRSHEEFPLRGDARSFEPSWSPDGTRIAVTELWRSWDIGTEFARSTIKILSLDTGRKVAVTRPRLDRVDTEPAWSPDGGTMAFARRQKGEPQTIWLIHPDGTGARQLTRGRSPSWSAAGDRLAFALGGSIYEVRADGSDRKRIRSGFRHPLVRWSPDGTKLLIASGRNAWVADADGRRWMRVLHEAYDVEGLAWRPS